MSALGFLTLFAMEIAGKQPYSVASMAKDGQEGHEATRAQSIHEHPVTFCLRANHGVLVSQSVIYITFLHVIFAFRMMEPFTWQ